MLYALFLNIYVPNTYGLMMLNDSMEYGLSTWRDAHGVI
jgi:hypothetical protein